jgi:hypothetical protein
MWLAQEKGLQNAYIYWSSQKKQQLLFIKIKKFCVEFLVQELTIWLSLEDEENV